MSSAADPGRGSGDASARVTIICSICMNPLMEEGSVQVATPCGHVFHQHCLINWYTSTEEYCCPTCDSTTESDSDCKFRLFLKTKEDSDCFAIPQTVTQLGREKDEMSEEKTNALERLIEEQMEAVDLLRQEHAEEVEQLRREHDVQIKRLQKEQVEFLRRENAKTKAMERTIQDLRQENAHTLERHVDTVYRVRMENLEETEGLHQLIQSQKDEIQLLNDEIQCQKDEIRNLKNPIDLLQKRVKALASEKLKREMDGLMEKFKRLDEAGGGNYGSGECGGAKAPRFKDFVRPGQTQPMPPGLHPTFPSISTSVTNAINIKGSGQVQVPGSSYKVVVTPSPSQPISSSVPTTSTTRPQQSSSEKNGGNHDSGVAASDSQNIDDITNNCGSITPTVQQDMNKQTKEMIEKGEDGWISSEDEDYEYLYTSLQNEPNYKCKKCRVVVPVEAREAHCQLHREQSRKELPHRP